MPRTTKKLFLLLFIVVAATILGSVVFSKPDKVKKRTIPLVISRLSTIKIEGTKIVDENTPAEGVEIVVRNISAKPVMAIDLVAGDGAVTKNGLTDEENPIVVIEPFGTTILRMGFGEMTPGAPLVVSAVTYGDGTEEGDEKSLRIMRKVRERDKQKLKAARKEGPQQ